MRSQEERIKSLHEQIDRIAGKYEIGHTFLIFEIVREGKVVIPGQLYNTELTQAPGIYDLKRDGDEEVIVQSRAEEMVLQAWAGIVTHGLVASPIGEDVFVGGEKEKEVIQ